MSQFKQWLNRWVNGLHWGNLRWLGNSRVVKSAYLWFFVVPLAARFIGPFAGEHDVTIPWFNDGAGATFNVTIALPFSWRMFYVMSLVFIVAQASYVIGCPEVVKRYSNYGEYRAEYAGSSQLLRLANHVITRGDVAEYRILYQKICELSDRQLSEDSYDLADKSRATVKANKALRIHLRSALDADARRSDSVWSDALDCFLELEGNANRRIFYFSGAFFGVGLILFGLVLLQNMYFTIRLFY